MENIIRSPVLQVFTTVLESIATSGAETSMDEITQGHDVRSKELKSTGNEIEVIELSSDYSDGRYTNNEEEEDEYDSSNEYDETGKLLVCRNPYEDMPNLDNMRKFYPNLRWSLESSGDKTEESVFVTLARYSLPETAEIMLPGITLPSIFTTCKHLVPRWTKSDEVSLTIEDKNFLESFCSKAVDSIEMSEWEQLRNIYMARDSWFVRQRELRYMQSHRVNVKKLPSKTRFFRRLPRCQSLIQAKAIMTNYECVVNLGSPVDMLAPPPSRFSASFPKRAMSTSYIPNREEHFLFSDAVSNATALRRSVRLQNRSSCIVQALKYQFDFDDEKVNDLAKVEDWPFDLDQQVDSGFDDTHAETEVSIFQCDERQLTGLCPDHFQYPSEQLMTSDGGLTRMEETAFDELENQIEVFYVPPKNKIRRTAAARTAEAIEKGSCLVKNCLPPSSNVSGKRHGSTGSVDVDEVRSRRLTLRSSSRVSIGSEMDVEVISSEKAILVSLKVPKEYTPIPSAKFLAEHSGKYLEEKDVAMNYDQTVAFPLEKPLVPLEEGSVPVTNSTESETGGCGGQAWCVLGCVCESLQSYVRAPREHCGKLKCLLGCVCVAKTPKAPLETRDIRLSLRSGVNKWKRPTNENAVPTKKLKRSSSVNADEERKRRRFTSVKSGVEAKDNPDQEEDNYMGDIDRAESSSEYGSQMSESPPVITLRSDEDSDDERPLIIVEDEEPPIDSLDVSQDISEQARESETYQKPVTPKVAEMSETVEKVQLRWSKPLGSIEEKGGDGNTRRLCNPLPLEFLDAREGDRTLCVVSIEESHNVLIEWIEECTIPNASAMKLKVGPLEIRTMLTLPLPPFEETYYLFKLPSTFEGDIQVHMLDMKFCLPLDQLQEARVKAEGLPTRLIQLFTPEQERIYAATGHPCDVYVFPDLPQLLVIGPYHTGADDDDFDSFAESSPPERIITPSSTPWGSMGDVPSTENVNWNGNGELIPRDYLETYLEDFMLEFPSTGRWNTSEPRMTKVFEL